VFQWHGKLNPRIPLLLTIPHSGEEIPPEARWLRELDSQALLTDVDRFVDRLYAPSAENLPVPALFTRVHRYAVDLNRYPEDIDAESVQGAPAEAGKFTRGFHWVRTTTDLPLMKAPIPRALHDELARKYHDAFHAEVARKLAELKGLFPGRPIFHLDCHSMPSMGTGSHLDAGKSRAQVVISDFEGKSASGRFKDVVLNAFRTEKFEISYNWPYKGGRITQRYGRPAEGHETVQIELNRSIYMDEATRERLPSFEAISIRLLAVLQKIVNAIEV
jgi:N-formylglutamate amidohydrolase